MATIQGHCVVIKKLFYDACLAISCDSEYFICVSSPWPCLENKSESTEKLFFFCLSYLTNQAQKVVDI